MYKKVSTGMNFVEREKEIEKFWRDNDIFKKSENMTPLKFRKLYKESITNKTDAQLL